MIELLALAISLAACLAVFGWLVWRAPEMEGDGR